ncbi:MAG: hypothetical protein WA421_08250 [Nitrososphaeraceae archaeon]
MERYEPIDVIRKWNKVIISFKNSLEHNNLNLNEAPFLRALSDTIIVTIPTDASFDYIINKAFDLLIKPFIESLRIGMLLRGAISYGRYYLSDRLIIGPALDDAAFHHDKLNWIGISLSPSLDINANNMISTNTCIYYNDIPHKDSHYSSFVLNWPIFDINGECYMILQQESVKVSESVKEKYSNTFKFYQNMF